MLYPYLVPFEKQGTVQYSVAILYVKIEQNQIWHNVSDKLQSVPKSHFNLHIITDTFLMPQIKVFPQQF